VIDFPHLNEQREIAATLSALDDKITNNTKINHHLEQMAQIAFERFLIDECVDEPIGLLSDIAEINPVRSLSRGQEAIYIEMANLPTHSSFPTDWTTRSFSGGMKFTNGDTIMARITPCLENGKTAYIDFLEENTVAFGSTEYIVIAAKPGYCSEMFYYLARYSDFVGYAVRNMNGSSGRQRVSGDTIGQYKLHIPSKENVRRFAEIATPIMKSIRQNALENRKLAALRDTLLPHLMSGELIC
jgi:type I restriction enzyme S subunit